MKRTKIATLLREELVGQSVTVMGWVKAFRNNQFIALNDGSTPANVQVVVKQDEIDEAVFKKIGYGAAIGATGTVVESLGKGQKIEVVASDVTVFGECPLDDYPMQPKKHSMEFLRDNAHLRPRTNTFGAVLRIRHALAFAIHKFFNDRGFFYLHTPVITASDAEGAGEMFRVSVLDPENPPRGEDGKIDFKKDFFGRPTNLTVSGQLEAELGALALGEVYTFGPTFRAENSNTTRHLAEFWMIEPEVAFADLTDNMDLAEAMLKYVIGYAMEHCPEDLKILEDRLPEEGKQPRRTARSDAAVRKACFVAQNPSQRPFPPISTLMNSPKVA